MSLNQSIDLTLNCPCTNPISTIFLKEFIPSPSLSIIGKLYKDEVDGLMCFTGDLAKSMCWFRGQMKKLLCFSIKKKNPEKKPDEKMFNVFTLYM